MSSADACVTLFFLQDKDSVSSIQKLIVAETTANKDGGFLKVDAFIF